METHGVPRSPHKNVHANAGSGTRHSWEGISEADKLCTRSSRKGCSLGEQAIPCPSGCNLLTECLIESDSETEWSQPERRQRCKRTQNSDSLPTDASQSQGREGTLNRMYQSQKRGGWGDSMTRGAEKGPTCHHSTEVSRDMQANQLSYCLHRCSKTERKKEPRTHSETVGKCAKQWRYSE